MAVELTYEKFKQHLNETFKLYINERETIDLELIEVMALNPPPAGGNLMAVPGVKIREKPFSLLFKGPLEWELPQQMYLIENTRMGRIRGIAMVPVGLDENGRYFESLFN